MVAIRHITLLLILAALSLSSSSVCARPAYAELSSNSSLFAQSAAQALANDFPSRDISFLLVDAHTGRVLASRWDNPDSPIPMGSLLKPFTALAYGEPQLSISGPHLPRHAQRMLVASWPRGRRPHVGDCSLLQFVFPNADPKPERCRCLTDSNPLGA